MLHRNNVVHILSYPVNANVIDIAKLLNLWSMK